MTLRGGGSTSLERVIERADQLLGRFEAMLPVDGRDARFCAVDRLSLAQARRARRHRAGRASAPHRAEGPAGHRSADGAGRCQHPSVRRGRAGQQRAAHRRARHRQVVAGEGGARQVRGQGPAADRDGEAGSGRSAGPRRSRRGCAVSLHPVLRRPVLRGRRAGLQGVEGGARRIDLRHERERPDLRDLEPAPPDAGVHERESRDRVRGRRDPSRARPWRRRSRCRSASACGCRSIPSTRITISPSRATGSSGSACRWTMSARMEREALQWALSRGSRSGRVAWHFARDYAGRAMLKARGARRRK